MSPSLMAVFPVLWSRPRNVPVADDVETERVLSPLPGVINADARPGHDLEGRKRYLLLGDDELALCEIVPVQAAIDVQRSAEASRAAGDGIQVRDRLEGPEKHGRCVASGTGHDVKAVVHAIDHVDVRMTGRT